MLSKLGLTLVYVCADLNSVISENKNKFAIINNQTMIEKSILVTTVTADDLH